MASAGHSQSGRIDWVALGKDLVALLRDAMLVFVFLLLILNPSFISGRLAAAGFEEGTIAGFKWKNRATTFGKELQNLTEELKDARDVIARQAATIEQNQQTLARLQAAATNPAVKERLAQLGQVNDRAKALSVQARADLGATLSQAAPVIAQAQQVIDPGAEWAVVFSGDRKLAEAQYEIARARRAGLSDPTLLLRKGVYRGIVPVASRDQADAVLAQVRQLQADARRRQDAYLVNLASWCPKQEHAGAAIRCV